MTENLLNADVNREQEMALSTLWKYSCIVGNQNICYFNLLCKVSFKNNKICSWTVYVLHESHFLKHWRFSWVLVCLGKLSFSKLTLNTTFCDPLTQHIISFKIFIHISSSLSCGDSLSDGLKKSKQFSCHKIIIFS